MVPVDRVIPSTFGAVDIRWLAHKLALAILILLAALSLLAVTTHWYFEDAGAYWEGAMRLREGEPLYVDHVIGPELYRYAPWFAWVWMPLTFLPESVVMAGWAVILVGSAAWLVWPDWRNRYSVALSLLIFPDLARVTSTGNVQPLLLALIAATLLTRWGPVVIGAMASLKAWPLLFAGWYGWKRQWDRLGVAVLVAVVLTLPALAFDLSAYPERPLVTPGTFSILLVVARVLRQDRGPDGVAVGGGRDGVVPGVERPVTARREVSV